MDGDQQPLHRKQSYYDADQDIYHLSQHVRSSDDTNENTKTMNSKTTILSTLQRELTTTLTKLTTARARIRFHETTQQRALEVMHTKHLEHVQRIKSTHHTTQRHFKAKLIKAHKEQTTAVLEKEQWQQQATALNKAQTW